MDCLTKLKLASLGILTLFYSFVTYKAFTPNVSTYYRKFYIEGKAKLPISLRNKIKYPPKLNSFYPMSNVKNSVYSHTIALYKKNNHLSELMFKAPWKKNIALYLTLKPFSQKKQSVTVNVNFQKSILYMTEGKNPVLKIDISPNHRIDHFIHLSLYSSIPFEIKEFMIRPSNKFMLNA